MRNPLTHPVERPHLRYFETVWEVIALTLVAKAWELVLFTAWMLLHILRWWRWLARSARRRLVKRIEGWTIRLEKAREERAENAFTPGHG